MLAVDPDFEPSRSAALARLANFVPQAGRPYADGRNIAPGPEGSGAVSRLSPYLRYRVLTEHEVVAAVLQQHSLAEAGKYVQEVLWRTYWKGWLEMRPFVWTRFLEERDRQRRDFPDQRLLAAAESGATGIEGFDDWARELVATGYLHNHVRMWFASIWIFTLRLPWSLGADFFLRHLLDADVASNTLSWRWVAGLQTVGKNYLATTENIARFTNGRYAPAGLAIDVKALVEPPVGPAQDLVEPTRADLGERSLLLVTHEDLNPESLFSREVPIVAAIVMTDSALLRGDRARAFVRSAADDVGRRVAAHFDCPIRESSSLDAEHLISAARAAGVKQVVTAESPVGPVADALARLEPALASEGIELAPIRRSWDRQCWPHAKKGYFAFRERIPDLLRTEGL